MADHSNIGWTDASWNPTTGCTEVSAECKNCYARELFPRLRAMKQEKYMHDFHEVRTHINELDKPFLWKKPRKVFVDSMSDLFHIDVPTSFIELVFDTMVKANWHIYQILTKRPARMRDFINYWLDKNKITRVPKHIWLGVSCGIQEGVLRIEILKNINAVRFVSCEPLLEPVRANFRGIDWVIVGGESGKGYRPIEKEWVESLREQCILASARFYFKQWGGNTPKSKGRELDGRTYDEFPNEISLLEKNK